MPQLDSTWFASQLFWLVITFATLYMILSRLVLPPLQEIIARRKQTIEGDIEQAQRLKSQAEQARQEYERVLAEARLAAQKLIDDAMAEQKAAAEKQGKTMDKQLEQQLAESARKIAARKKELVEALTPTTAELSALIVKKLMQAPPSSEQASRVIGQAGKR
jgi:F-type H+-transporting ATPase subunit b